MNHIILLLPQDFLGAQPLSIRKLISLKLLLNRACTFMLYALRCALAYALLFEFLTDCLFVNFLHLYVYVNQAAHVNLILVTVAHTRLPSVGFKS